MAAIEIKNLTHRFEDGTCGLKCINLIIREGEFMVLAGRNGSGKTLLTRHINGLLSPTAGSVSIEGQPIAEKLLWARQVVGLVFQDSESQIVGETVASDVAFGPRNLMLSQEEIDLRVSSSLKAVNLTEFADFLPHLLSGGEKRRLAIAGILAMHSRILIFDEPFSSLDCEEVRQVLERIVTLNQSGRTVIVITHDLGKVLAHADRLVLMDAGRIVRDGPPAEIMSYAEECGVRAPTGDFESFSWLR